MSKKILHVVSSPRGAASISNQLGNAIVQQILEKYPGATLTERNLAKNHAPFLDEFQIGALFTPAESRTPEQQQAIRFSDESIAELREADIIVIDAPLYNFGVVASLKAYLDLVARPKLTFSYNEQGQPEGLLKNKKTYIAFSAGHVYSEGPYQSFDFVIPYLRQILGFLGLNDISIVRAEGVSVPGIGETALQKGIESIAID